MTPTAHEPPRTTAEALPLADASQRCEPEPFTIPAAVPGVGVPSPCVRLCRIEPASGLCAGCARTLDEIAAWSRLDDTGRQAVWQRVLLRRQAGVGG